MLDKRPAKAATALHSSPPRGPLPGEQATQASSERPWWILGAESRFREALRLDPEHPAAWIRLGVLLWARGQRDDATQAWAQAVSLAPRWGDYQPWEIRLAVSEVPEAAAVARGRLAFNLGALLEQYRQPGQALEQYRVAVALSPDDVTACGRVRRLAMSMAPCEPVTCAPEKRP